MMSRGSLFLILCLFALASSEHPLGTSRLNAEEQRALSFLNRAEEKLLEAKAKKLTVRWAYDTNITSHNEARKLAYQKIFDSLTLDLGRDAKAFDQDQIMDKDIKRKLKMLSRVGTSVLPQNKLDRYNKLTNDMFKIYSTAKVPGYNDKYELMSLEPEITDIMANSENLDELEYYWTQWRDQTGVKMRDMYWEYVELTNEAAKLNGFRDGTEMKIEPFESDNFVEEMEDTWRGLKPLYQELHAYVRHKLLLKFGEDVITPDGPIPAHLLGSMMAAFWSHLSDVLRPYPNKPDVDVTDEMIRQNWTQKTMFQKADEFFQSMGLEPMPKEFWEHSLIKKPDDGRELICHATAWDFYNGNDFRIKQCTTVKQEDFITVNHEMGHVQYFMNYKNQSVLYRAGANPGFHEGVADILSIAVGTAGYFQRLGLLSKDIDITDKETNINILFNMALQRLAFLPFGYLVDKYRWDLYSGHANKNNMNCHWHKLRLDIQGVSPPNMRDETQFEAGGIYHVPADVDYVRYFTAYIYQFQFYRALCLESGQYDPNDPDKPLHRCNFYGSKAAGKKLVSMLKLGASKPWKEVIEVMTGKPEMSTDAFREYFKPLEEWLKEENARNGVMVGWTIPSYEEYCKSSGINSGTIATPTFYFVAALVVLSFYT